MTSPEFQIIGKRQPYVMSTNNNATRTVQTNILPMDLLLNNGAILIRWRQDQPHMLKLLPIKRALEPHSIAGSRRCGISQQKLAIIHRGNSAVFDPEILQLTNANMQRQLCIFKVLTIRTLEQSEMR